MRRTLRALTTLRLDGRSAIAVAVRRWKADIRRGLGRDLTRAQQTIREDACPGLLWRDDAAIVEEVVAKGAAVRVEPGARGAAADRRDRRIDALDGEDFRPSEMVALTDAIEGEERRTAKERQREHAGTARGRHANTPGKLPGVNGRARDKVAKYVGVSGRTLEPVDEAGVQLRSRPLEHTPVRRVARQHVVEPQCWLGYEAPGNFMRLTPISRHGAYSPRAYLDSAGSADVVTLVQP